MKILFISDYYPPHIKGGAEVSTSLLVDWLKKDHNVSVICSAFNNVPWFQHGVPVWPVIDIAHPQQKTFFASIVYAWRLVYFPLISAWRVLRIVRNLKPDVVQVVPSSYQFIPTILVLRVFMNLPIVIDCRDYSIICPAHMGSTRFDETRKARHGYLCLRSVYTTNSAFLNFFIVPFAVYESLLFRLCQSLLKTVVSRLGGVRLVAISRFVEGQLLLNGFRSEAVEVIPNISSMSAVSEVAEDIPIPTFVFAGQMVSAKGVWDIVDAAALLEQRGYHCSVKMAGDGREFTKVRDAIDSRKIQSITLLGKIPPAAVIDLYASSSVVLGPSRWPEPSGRFVIEAIAAGKPLIAARSGGIPENIEDGKTGILIDAGHPEQLADAMEQFIRDPHKGVSMKAAIERRRNTYAAETIGTLRLNLYSRIKRLML